MSLVYPSNVILEVAAVCNLSCLGCAIHGPHRFTDRSLGVMGKEVWGGAITEIGSWNHPVNLTCHGGGEPLLNPNLRDILTLAKSFPIIQTGFLTNGMLMDADWSKFVVDRQVDWVFFSIDGIDPETHRLVRKHSDLERIEANVLALIDAKKAVSSDKPAIGLNMVAYDEVLDQRRPFIQRWIDRVDSVMISHYRNPPDNRRWPIIPVVRRPCSLLWHQMVIAWDGRIGLCCEDFNIDYPIGCIEDSSLLEIYNGSKINQFRLMHKSGDFDAHPLCSICDTWADDLVYEGVDPSGYRIKCRASQTEYMRE